MNLLQKRFTCSEGIQNFVTKNSLEIICKVEHEPVKLLTLLMYSSVKIKSIDITDASRITLVDESIVLFIPSGNVETECFKNAYKFVTVSLKAIKNLYHIQ